MTAHAGAPGLVRCIADRASATAPAGTHHRAGLAVPSPQQPPWQIEWLASPHALSHWPVVVLQAVPMGQSPAPRQNGTSGAHRSFDVLGVKVPAPNWSSQATVGGIVSGHFTV